MELDPIGTELQSRLTSGGTGGNTIDPEIPMLDPSSGEIGSMANSNPGSYGGGGGAIVPLCVIYGSIVVECGRVQLVDGYGRSGSFAMLDRMATYSSQVTVTGNRRTIGTYPNRESIPENIRGGIRVGEFSANYTHSNRSIFSFSQQPRQQQTQNVSKKTLEKFDQAIDDALEALKKESCRNLFGKDTDPTALLQSLYAAVGPTLGAIELDDLGAYNVRRDDRGKITSRRGVGGLTTGITGSIINKNGIKVSIFTGAHIQINSNENGPFVEGYYDYLNVGASDRTYRAITIIHELGHALYTLFGSNASPIVPDADGQVNKDNSQRVYDACFKK